MDSVAGQVRVICVMAAGGVCLGLVFDSSRVLRGIVRPGRLASVAGDFAFWLVATVIVAVALVVSNHGQVRLGAFVGLGLGMLVYWRLLSRPCLLALSSSCRLASRAIATCTALCRKPLSVVRECGAVMYHRAASVRGLMRRGRLR